MSQCLRYSVLLSLGLVSAWAQISTGTIVGAVAGGGKGAAIGALSGVAAGAATQSVTRGKGVRIPAETVLSFRLEAPIRIREMR